MRKISVFSENFWIFVALLLPVFALLVPRASAPAILILLAQQSPRLLEANAFSRTELRILAGLLVALVAWELLGLAWAQHGLRLLRPMAMSAIFYFAAILLCLVPPTLSRKSHNILARVLAGGWIVMTLTIALDMATGGGFFNAIVAPATGDDGVWLPRWSNRALTYGALLLWPLAAAYGVKRIALVTVLCLFHMGIAAWIGHVTSLLATLFATTAFFCVRRFGVLAVYACSAITVVTFLVMPFASFGPLAPHLHQSWLQDMLPSAWHRLLIWEHASKIILDHPLRGLGLDSFRYLPSAKADLKGWQENELIVLHPHNGMLQVWLELGLPGVLVFVAALMTVFRLIARMEQQSAAAATALTVSVLVFANLSFGMWQSWWQGLVGLSAALLMTILAPRLSARDRGVSRSDM